MLKNININATPETVWELITDPEKMKLWISDVEMKVESARQAGGAIIISGKWNGAVHENKGTILKFEPLKVFAYNAWSRINRLPDLPENYIITEFRIDPESDHQIRLTVVQSNLLTESIFKHFEFYWNVTLGLIKKLAEGN